MRRKAEIWLKGLLAAAISGAANGLTTGLTAITIAPDTFNMNGGLTATLQLVGASALVSAVTGASTYLKQSPIPPDEVDTIPVLPAVESQPPPPPAAPGAAA
jgi:hypothetical protein